ncbi:MAG: Gx transporter family protein [Clostridia bacterium]|nr:Gx transporter family protein [Clostridia bacterium]
MNLKRLTTDALLTAFALIIFIIEAQIPPVVPIPGIKLGLSNIITLTSFYIIGKKDALIILVLRIVLGSVFSGNISSLIFSLCGGILCYIAMCIFHGITKEKIWVTSVLCAIAHNTGQIIAAVFVMKSTAVLWYFPYLLISAIITGAFTGIIVQNICKKGRGLK